MVFDISKLSDIVKEFMDFMYEQKILGFFIGAFIGLSTSEFIGSFKKNILDNILTKLFKLTSLNSLFFITSIIEYLLMLFILYIIIKLIKPYFDKRDTEKKESENDYQNKLLSILNNINKKIENLTF